MNRTCVLCVCVCVCVCRKKPLASDDLKKSDPKHPASVWPASHERLGAAEETFGHLRDLHAEPFQKGHGLGAAARRLSYFGKYDPKLVLGVYGRDAAVFTKVSTTFLGAIPRSAHAAP